MPFTNNLQKNDRVFDTASKRQGKVMWTPRSPEQRRTAVLFDGHRVATYLDVMQLRLVVGGKTIEEVPPVDGMPPEETDPTARKKPAAIAIHPTTSAVDTLKAERTRNAEEMMRIEGRFKTLKSANEKIDRAISVLVEQA